MGAPSSIFRGLTGMARDWPRDRMPDGYVWDLADYVPVLLDAQLTGRGAWAWASAAAPAQINGGIHAPFRAGDRLLLCAGSNLYEVNQTTGALSASIGTIPVVKQNPIMFNDMVVIPSDGTLPAKIVTAPAGALTLANVDATAPKGLYAAVYKNRVMLAGDPAKPSEMAACRIPGALYGGPPPIAATGPADPWDANTVFRTSLTITGIGALRSMILMFHAGSVERIRGALFPQGNSPGDMFIDNLFDRAGCGDARSIAYWNDNCIFADERGVHLTDGAVVRNMISQGGMITFWRRIFRNRLSIASCTYLDYYITTIVDSSGAAYTLVCDLQRRSWFRFTNIKAISYIQSVGEQERIWVGHEPEHRLVAMADCFFPPVPPVLAQVDGNGQAVLPSVESPWFRMEGGEGRKRARFVYTSYDVRHPDAASELNGAAVAALGQMLEVGYITSPQDPTYAVAGRLPNTQRYKRYKLPLGIHPYGIAFRIKQISPSAVTRVFDFAVEELPEEKSRV